MERDLRSIKSLLSIIVGVLVCYLLSIMSTLIIPLVLALFLAILLQPILAYLQRKKFPFILSLFIILVGITSFFYLVGAIVYETTQSIVEQKDELLTALNLKIEGLIQSLDRLPLKIGLSESSDFTTLISDSLSKDFIVRSSSSFAGAIGTFSGSLIMTLLYLIAMLGGILRYEEYIEYIENDYSGEGKFLKSFEEVKTSIVAYMKVHTLISLLTGLCFYLACLFFGVSFPLFWGFLAFLLNYIPTIGSIAATIPPTLLSLIEFNFLGTTAIFVAILILIQFFLGNVIEPILNGKRLSLNTVTVILGLVFWGYLWGATGLLLSVPLLVLIKVILNQIPEAKMLVKMMGKSPEP
ncbi:MAG: AI-2E family transporter [Bacteroidota bacterium]